MKRSLLRGAIPAVLALASLAIVGCKSLQDLSNALSAYQKLQFKLGQVHDFQVNSVSIDRISRPSQLSPLDAARLAQVYASGKLPVSFTVDLLVKNPNDGSNARRVDLYLKKLAWRLSIDGTETISGIVDRRIEIPGSGATVTLPMTMSLDLMKFFQGRGYEDLLNLALAVGGASGSSSNLKLTATATVETPVGDIRYPGELTIVNTTFTNP